MKDNRRPRKDRGYEKSRYLDHLDKVGSDCHLNIMRNPFTSLIRNRSRHSIASRDLFDCVLIDVDCIIPSLELFKPPAILFLLIRYVTYTTVHSLCQNDYVSEKGLYAHSHSNARPLTDLLEPRS